MNTWRQLHRYNNLVQEEQVPPLNCPDCDEEFTWLIGQDDEPVAYCAYELKKFFPGTNYWLAVKTAIADHME